MHIQYSNNLREHSLNLFPFLIALLFPIVGIAGLLSPIFEWFKAKNTVYVITNKRVFTIHFIRTREFLNIDLGKIENIEKKVRSDGSGDLILYKDFYLDSDKDKQTKEHGFLSVPDVKEAERHIERLQQTVATDKTDKALDEVQVTEPMVSPDEVSDIDSRLQNLYSKIQTAKESSTFVLQTKAIELIDKKKASGLELNQKDKDFLKRVNNNQRAVFQDMKENPMALGIIVVFLLIFYFSN